jgi:hypothetical protein
MMFSTQSFGWLKQSVSDKNADGSRCAEELDEMAMAEKSDELILYKECIEGRPLI